MSSETDYYSVLNLKPGSSVEEVRRQYRRLAKVYHPDRNPGEEEWCAEQLTQVNTAYEYLSNAERKAAYDRNLSSKRNVPPKSEPAAASGSQKQASTPRQQNQSPYTASRPKSTGQNGITRTARPVVAEEPPKPTGKQIAIMLIGGASVGLVGALLSMALFNYLNPPQSRHTVLPAQTLYVGKVSHSSPTTASHSHVAEHRHHYRHEDTPTKHAPDTTAKEANKLNNLGVKVPPNMFTKQEMAEMAARLERYDKTH